MSTTGGILQNALAAVRGATGFITAQVSDRRAQPAVAPLLPALHKSGTLSGVTRSTLAQNVSVARTVRFPTDRRNRIISDADRCGRSFEGQVIALLRRHCLDG